MKIKLLNSGGYLFPNEYEFPSSAVSALRVSDGFLIVGRELNHLCGDEYFSDDVKYFFYPNECEVINGI